MARYTNTNCVCIKSASKTNSLRQTINDIYEAAEHLLLPPARRENVPADQSTVQYDNPMMHRQLSDEDEIPEVEDFWGAVPDY